MSKDTECLWTLDPDDECWDTGCGHRFHTLEGSLQDNGFVYCPYCGKMIKEVT